MSIKRGIAMNTEDYTNEYDTKDISESTVMAILSYLGFLWIIPFFFRMKKSPYTKFHVNQGLTLFLAEVICSFAGKLLAVFFGFIGLGIIKMLINMIVTFISVFWLVIMVMGIVNAINNTARELPIIGKIRIIK